MNISVLDYSDYRFSIGITRSLSENSKEVLMYLNSLSAKKNNRVISGQFISYTSGVYSPEGAPFCNSFDACFNAQVEELVRQAGKYPGIIGLDYGFSTDEQQKAANETIKLRWKDSGLVTISWHANHPFQMGPFRSGNMVNTGPDENSSLQEAYISLATDLTNNSDTVEAKNWRDSLAKIADRMVALKNSGYVILWRPFHEMNGDWFWWGKQDPSAFIKIWINMWEYFTYERGLDNLLWVYSPNSGNGKYLKYYPATKYVDIVGLDIYATPPLTIGGYQELRNLGKPLGLTEFGRGCPDAVTCEETGGFTNPLLIKRLGNCISH